MTASESLALFGLVPSESSLPQIRAILEREAELERTWQEREDDLAVLSCVQLFAYGSLEDVLRIWDAKRSGFDLGIMLDVQFLCGAGLAETKAFLMADSSESAKSALAYINKCEEAGDFEDFTPNGYLKFYRQYFSAG